MSPPDPHQNKKIEEVDAILSLNRALWGEVFPSLRSARIDWTEDKIILYFYHDGEISEDDWDSAHCVGTEVIADFPYHKLEVNIERCDYPQRPPQIGELVYRRKEQTPEDMSMS